MHRNIVIYCLVFFLLGIVAVCHLIFRNINLSLNESEEPQVYSTHHFSQKLNTANTFYKNRLYPKAIEMLERIDIERLTKKQIYSLLILKACCYHAMGLYHTAMDHVSAAVEYREHPFCFFLQGILELKQKNNLAAIALFNKAIRLDPFYYYAYEKIGDIYFQEGNYENALNAYLGANRDSRNLPESLQIKASLCHLFKNEPEEAITYIYTYEEYSKSQEYKAHACFIQAIAGDRLGYFRSASRAFQKAIDLATEGDRPVFEYHYALYLIRKNKIKEATQIFTSLAEENQGERKIGGIILGQLSLLSGDYQKSDSYFRENIESVQSPRDLYYAGVAAFKVKHFKRSSDILDRLISKDTRGDYTLSAYILLALSHIEMGSPSQAVRVLSIALEEVGERSEIVDALGYVMLTYFPQYFNERMGKYLHDPKYNRLNLFLSDHYLKKKNFNSSLAFLMEYVQHSPMSGAMAKDLGDFYLQRKEYRSAEIYYRQVFSLDKDESLQGETWNNLAYCQCAQGRMKEARSSLERARRLSPQSPGVYLNLFLLMKNLGNKDDSEKFLQMAVEKAEGNSNSKLKGKIFLEAGLFYLSRDPARSKQFLKQAIQEDADNQIAEYYLKSG